MISIIIPVYNMANSLGKCIDSIISQRKEGIEIVLVDDGSYDNSWDLCKDAATRYGNVKAIHQENQGSGPARNAGIINASGDYYLFIDSDDVLAEGALSKLSHYAEETQADLIVFGYTSINKNETKKEKKYKNKTFSGEEIRNDYSRFFCSDFEWGIQGAPWNKLFKASVIRENKVEYPALKRHQDEIFISRFVNYTKNVMFIGDCFYYHYTNDSKLVYRKYPKNYIEIVEKVYQFRKEIIEPWNKQNQSIKALIYSEYVNNVIRACFRAFNKEEFKSFRDRVKWYEYNTGKMDIQHFNYPIGLLGIVKKYQNLVFVRAVKKKHQRIVDLLIRLRILTM